ncbi:Cell surface superoxide dismutase [Cu-Zn] 4 [Dispira simplex]|nr:Cell surface superoxide dismutase [Cu-Zn] 4 [Dispira simplex]
MRCHIFCRGLLLLAALATMTHAQSDDEEIDIFHDEETTDSTVEALGQLGAVFTSGVKGVVWFESSQAAAGKLASVSVNVQINHGLQRGKRYAFNIHDNSAPKNGKCTNLGNVYDPFMINQSNLYQCQRGNSNSYRATCSIGDLTGKFGTLNVTSEEGAVSGQFEDPSLELTGTYSVENRTVALRVSGSKDIVACGTIRSLEQSDLDAANTGVRNVIAYSSLVLSSALVMVSSFHML